MKLKNCFVIAMLVLICSVAQASASVIEYTDVTLFNAAVPGATSYNFEGIAPVNGFSVVSPTVGGVAFTAPNSTPFVIGDNFYGPDTFGGAAFFSGQGPLIGPSNVTATLTSGVTAIGFFYGPGDDAGGAITVTLSTGDVFSLAIPDVGTADFVGFTSTTPITSVAFTEAGYGMDIVQFEATTPVPIPAAIYLIGSGLIGLMGIKRKFKN